MGYYQRIKTMSSIAPLMIILSVRNLELNTPSTINMLRQFYFTFQLLYFGVLLYMHRKIKSIESKNIDICDNDISPPGMMQKFFPSMADPKTAIKRRMTTIDYQTQILMSTVKSSLFSMAFIVFLHFKFSINPSLLMQPLFTILKLLECPLFRLHVLGHTEAGYEELKMPFKEVDLLKDMNNAGDEENEAANSEEDENTNVEIIDDSSVDETNEDEQEEDKDSMNNE
eukprot:GAHX01001162.1.p1 GENE.GAHX01001162.1~~GAHX01001162.1.p1  ORF type:complete len:227 (-),score=48.76 GAHX01001162.1:35-715(-)